MSTLPETGGTPRLLDQQAINELVATFPPQSLAMIQHTGKGADNNAFCVALPGGIEPSLTSGKPLQLIDLATYDSSITKPQEVYLTNFIRVGMGGQYLVGQRVDDPLKGLSILPFHTWALDNAKNGKLKERLHVYIPLVLEAIFNEIEAKKGGPAGATSGENIAGAMRGGFYNPNQTIIRDLLGKSKVWPQKRAFTFKGNQEGGKLFEQFKTDYPVLWQLIQYTQQGDGTFDLTDYIPLKQNP